MKTSVYTTLISASVLSAVLTGLGLLESRFLMRMIQTSDILLYQAGAEHFPCPADQIVRFIHQKQIVPLISLRKIAF